MATTIRLCGLNDRDLLVTRREQAQQDAIRDFFFAAGSLSERTEEGIQQVIRKVCGPEKEYSAARWDAIVDLFEVAYKVCKVA